MALFLAIMAALLAGLQPLAMPLGWAAGGVFETGQAAPGRWWLGALGAMGACALLGWRLPLRLRLWWLAMLMVGLATAVIAFVHIASVGQARGGVGANAVARALRVGVVTALPLFWTEKAGEDLGGTESGGMPLPRASRHRLIAVDYVDARTLANVDAMVLAQPRLMQPEELVALDAWVRAGGRAVIYADPLLLWPTDLSLGDPRRPPLTSLLDPLLAHWGLTLEAADVEGGAGVERRMLPSGHVLLLAGASRFTLTIGDSGASCRLEEGGLFARCRVGNGRVRLVADADMLDDRLWLADGRWPERREAHASDIVALVDGWANDPLAMPLEAAPRRITDDAAIVRAMRAAILLAILWAGLGWAGHRRVARGCVSANGGDEGEREGNKMKPPPS